MSEAEVAAFELRLADDQAARESLARAVELTQVVATAESLEPVVALRSPSSSWTKRLAWMAIGSAASLLVALLWSNAGSWFSGKSIAAADQLLLAKAWSQMRQELADSDSDLWYPKHLAAGEPAAGETAASDDQLESPSDPGDLDPLNSVAPSWMTAAVESYPNEPSDPDSTPFDGERSEN
jgi:hypothetical protein